MSKHTATLNIDDGKTAAVAFPVLPGTIGPEVIDIRALYGKSGMFTYDPGFMSTAACTLDDHLHRRRQGRIALSRLSDRTARGHLRFSRSVLPAAQRRTAERRAEERLREDGDYAHDGARADEPVLPGLSPRLASDGDAGRRGRVAFRLLSRFARHHRPSSSRSFGHPPDREASNPGRDVLQVHDGPAVRVSAQRTFLRGQFHPHDVFGAVRGIPGERRRRPRARSYLHSACGPRAKRVDVDRSTVGLFRRQSVCLHRRGNRLSLGTGTRRRQRGCVANARGHRRRDRKSATSSSAPRTRTPASS